MKLENYFKSISDELTGLKNRVRDFIEDAHWLTDGEWKESVLKSLLGRAIPKSVSIGRGFIITPEGPSTQIDILLYSSDSPVLFRDGDLVFVQPESVVGIIEVKSKIDLQGFRNAIEKLVKMGRFFSGDNPPFLSLFAYDFVNVKIDPWLKMLQEITTSKSQIVHLICLGDSRFIRYWDERPKCNHLDIEYEHWHSYNLRKMAFGYFIHNILLFLSPKYVDGNQSIWFPKETKEFQLDGKIQRIRGKGEARRFF